MKSILERALVHLLNEENEKAEELMHQFIIETARNIHENLREGDEIDFDMDSEGEEENFFSDADLADDEAADAEEDLGDAMDMPEMEGEEIADDELADEDFGDEETAEEGDVEDKIDEIEDELADLTAKFEEMMASLDAEDAGDDVADEEPAIEDDSAEEDFGGEDFAADEGDEAEADADAEGEEEEDFEDITEAVIDELKKATVPNTDGRGATGGQNVTANSRASMHGQTAKPHPAKSTGGEHKSWDREAAPKTVPTQGGSTIAQNADWNAEKTEKNSSVPATGEKVGKSFKGGAKLNSDKSAKDKSVVGRTKNPK